MTTNVVITPNQTWGHCPEDPESVPESVCVVTDRKTNHSQDCTQNYDSNLSKSSRLSMKVKVGSSTSDGSLGTKITHFLFTLI